MRRFASPLGFLGQSHRNPLDASRADATILPSSSSWAPGRVPEPHDLLSVAAPSQSWSVSFAAPGYSNVMRLRANELPCDVFDTEPEVAPATINSSADITLLMLI